jgi:hypothetical protein
MVEESKVVPTEQALEATLHEFEDKAVWLPQATVATH